jgi:ABC-type lipoprotein release transport system permease subunit
LGGAIGGFIGLVGGIFITAIVPSVATAVNNNPVLYYLPTAVSAVFATLVIVKMRY